MDEANAVTDDALLRAYVQGDTAAWRRLFELYAPELYAMGIRHLHDDAAATELVLGSFVELHRARRQFASGIRLRFGLLRIGMNLLRDRWRKAESRLSRERSPAEARAFDVELGYRMLESRLAAEARSPLAPLRELSAAARSGIVSLLAASIAVIAASTADTHHLLQVSTPLRLATDLLVFGILFEVTLALALRPPHRPWPRRSSLVLFVLGGLGATAMVAGYPPTAPASAWIGPASTPFTHAAAAGLPCLAIGLLAAIPTYLAIRICDRGGRISRWLSAAAAALAGNFTLTLTCPLAGAAHRLSTHASLGPLLLACLALATLASRVAGSPGSETASSQGV